MLLQKVSAQVMVNRPGAQVVSNEYGTDRITGNSH